METTLDGLKEMILDAVSEDAKIRRAAEFPFRHHLGASILGHTCERYLFYTFRWAQEPDFSSRILRIFERGKEEEDRIIDKLRSIGLVITDKTDGGEQLRAHNLPNHIGGSLDGMLHVPAQWAQFGEYMPIEIKTHNNANFNATFRKMLSESKPEHYVQANTYGWSWGCTHFMYVGLNKNTDELNIQFVEVNPTSAQLMVERGRRVVYATAFNMIPKTDEKWRCKMCPFQTMCKQRLRAQSRNCRSCKWAYPHEDGTWVCGKHMHQIVKFNEIIAAEHCDDWESVV